MTVGQETGAYPVGAHRQRAHRPRCAVDHLLELGHRRIGILGAQAEDPAYFDVPGAAHRRRAPVAGRALVSSSTRRSSPTGSSPSTAATRRSLELLDRSDRPSAIFALSDEMAFGAVLAARDLGLDVPGDVSADRRRRSRGGPGHRA